MTMKDKLAKLSELEKKAKAGGGEKRIQQQHDKGKLTARERLDLLLDKGSFEELDPFVTHRTTEFGLADKQYPGDAVITGFGKVDGRTVFVYAQDFTVLGGTISEVSAQKVCKVMDMAVKNGAPIIAIWDSGGARIQEGVISLCGVGEILLRNSLYSGVVPQLSVVMGPSAGGAVYSPAITDFVFMVKGTSQMYITGPDVVKAVISIDITHEELGGAKTHAEKSGVAHFISDNEPDCLKSVRRLLGFLPQSYKEEPPALKPSDDPERTDEKLRTIIPEAPNKVYDMKQIILSVADNGDFMEVHQSFAPSLITGFARLNGKTVGIVAQQPAHMAGIIDINASVKGARFVRCCDAFSIPLVSFVDVPGFMPGPKEEQGGIIRHGAKFIFAYAEATVPKLTVITRKAYGGAYIVMSSKHLRGDINYAWPTAEIAVMGPEGAVNIIYREAIAKAKDGDKTRKELVAQYKESFANPYQAAARGYIDNVIDPKVTRPKLIRALESLKNAGETARPKKKHGNIPL
ncbi:MAG: methylmalonyl-CoA carboxyltransferase [Dehalococcoidia bacterium]|nr:methylmalonyl-CoA carboxyltransferase [Dehalococcoidia bacterium]